MREDLQARSRSNPRGSKSHYELTLPLGFKFKKWRVIAALDYIIRERESTRADQLKVVQHMVDWAAIVPLFSHEDLRDDEGVLLPSIDQTGLEQIRALLNSTDKMNFPQPEGSTFTAIQCKAEAIEALGRVR